MQIADCRVWRDGLDRPLCERRWKSTTSSVSMGRPWRATHAGRVSLAQLKVMSAIETCRTAALGGHVESCQSCGHTRIAYNSCRNRHCPKCQALTTPKYGGRPASENLHHRRHTGPRPFCLKAAVRPQAMMFAVLKHRTLIRSRSATLNALSALCFPGWSKSEKSDVALARLVHRRPERERWGGRRSWSGLRSRPYCSFG